MVGYDDFRRPGEWLLVPGRICTEKEERNSFRFLGNSWMLWFTVQLMAQGLGIAWEPQLSPAAERVCATGQHVHSGFWSRQAASNVG